MNETINTILSRRSCKSYKPDMVPAGIIDEIIEAGLYAASGNGLQSPIILAVTDRDTRDLLSRLNAKYDPKKRKDPFYGAPVVLSVLGPKSVPTHTCDASLVIGNMLLAAHALGIGACWIHRAKEVFEDDEGRSLLQKLGIGDDYEGVGNCVIGYPETMSAEKVPRKEGRVWRV